MIRYKNIIYSCIATFFFLGYMPVASGTFGTLGAMLLYGALLYFGWASISVLALCLVLSGVANIIVGAWAENYFGQKDPKQVVIDEVAGYFLTVLLFKPSLMVGILGFFFFRFFDIVKVYPTKKLEALPAGWGILTDDLMAGVYSGLGLALISFLGVPIELKFGL